MNTRLWTLLTSLIVVAMVLGGCGPSTSPSEVDEQVKAAQATAEAAVAAAADAAGKGEEAVANAQATAEAAISAAAAAEADAVAAQAEAAAAAAEAEAAAKAKAAAEAEAAAKDEGPIVLTVMSNWSGQDTKAQAMRELMEEFNTAHPGIIVKHENPGGAWDEVAETRFLVGEEPEMVLAAVTPLTSLWLDNGVSIELADMAEELGLAAALRDVGVREYTDSQGRLLAFPLEGFTWPIWYNTEIFAEAGVDIPQTTDELIAAAAAIRAAGYQPLSMCANCWQVSYAFKTVLSSLLSDAELAQVLTEGGFADSPRAVEAVELFVELRDAGVFVDSAEGLEYGPMNHMFYDKEAAMNFSGAWAYGECERCDNENTFLGGFPLAEGSAHEKPVTGGGFGAKGVWVTRNGAAKLEAVKEFLKFWYSPEIMAKFEEQAGMNSPLKESAADVTKLLPLFAQTFDLEEWAEFSTITTFAPTTPAELAGDFDRICKEAFIPGTPAEQIIADLDAMFGK